MYVSGTVAGTICTSSARRGGRRMSLSVDVAMVSKYKGKAKKQSKKRKKKKSSSSKPRTLMTKKY